MTGLTVGLPLKNSALYLKPALDSVMAQTFQDWILLAIDDASSDSTAAIVQDYAKQDPRIRFIQGGPQPLTQAQNWSRVIQLAETDYVSMFGHDDIMQPDLLQRQIELMESHPDMVMAFAQGPFIADKGELLRSQRGNPIMQPNWPEDRILPPGSLGPQLILEGFVHPSSVMMKTAVAQSIPLFPENMPLYLDIDYWSRLGDCGSVGYVAGDLLRYRLRTDSAYDRALRGGINLRDANVLYQRMMAHWNWDTARQTAYKKDFYTAHASRALRAAEMAREKGDQPTARLQMAICLAHARTAQSDPHAWIARWWNIAVFHKKFSSPRRLALLQKFCSLPVLKAWLYQHYAQPLPGQ